MCIQGAGASSRNRYQLQEDGGRHDAHAYILLVKGATPTASMYAPEVACYTSTCIQHLYSKITHIYTPIRHVQWQWHF